MKSLNILNGKLKDTLFLLLSAGIVASLLATPILTEAKSKMSRLKQSMSETKTIAMCFSAYFSDYNTYPNTEGKAIPLQDVDSLLPDDRKMVPDYILYFPNPDGWKKGPYYYASNGQHFIIYSLGSDGKADADLEEIIKAFFSGKAPNPKATSCNENDIIWGDNGFLKYADGEQKKCS